MDLTNYNVVLDLAESLKNDAAAIYNENQELSARLKALEASFLDDGIEEVKSVVDSIKKKIDDNLDNIAIICRELQKFAILLIENK